METIRIKETEIFLDDQGDGKGKITISNTYGKNFSCFWGAMGGTLKDFLLAINEEYFANKLMGAQSLYVFDAKSTCSNIRKHIRNEIMPWYKHVEFQKEMRSAINHYWSYCESSNEFVSNWKWFVDQLPYHFIDDEFERKNVENAFKEISEPWHFIGERESDACTWLKALHKSLKKELQKQPVLK